MGRGRCWGCLFECTLIHLVFPEHLLCAGEGMEGSETFLWQRAGKRFTLIPHRRASSRGDAPDHQVESSGFHQPGQPWCLLIPGKPEDPGPSHYQPLPSLQPTGSRIFHLDLDRWVGLSLSVVRGGAVGLRRSLLEDHGCDWRPRVEPHCCFSLFHPWDMPPAGPAHPAAGDEKVRGQGFSGKSSVSLMPGLQHCS